MLVDEKGPGPSSAGAEADLPRPNHAPWSFTPQRYKDTSRMIHFLLKHKDKEVFLSEPPPSTPSIPETPEPVYVSPDDDTNPTTTTSSDEAASRRGRKTLRRKKQSLRTRVISTRRRRRRSRPTSKNTE